MSISLYERVTDAGRERRCNKCREWWTLESFARNPRCARGRTGECTACRCERRRKYRMSA